MKHSSVFKNFNYSARDAADNAKNDTDHSTSILHTVQERTDVAESNASTALSDAFE